MIITKAQLIKDCLQIGGEDAVVYYPYGPDCEVLKNAKGKGYALMGVLTVQEIASIKSKDDPNAPIDEGDIFLTVKCPPKFIISLRDKYAAVIPGYYSNKNHWNTIILNKDVPYEEVLKMVQLSYDLVTPKPKK